MTHVNTMHTPGERVAIVAGLRTPFARQLSAYKDLNAIELGVMVTRELLARMGRHALRLPLPPMRCWQR